MKTRIIKKITAVTLTALLALGTVSFTQNKEIETLNESSQSIENAKSQRCVYINPQIIDYLEEFGYTNVTLYSIPGSCDKMADTEYSYNTIVFVSGASIVGHEDTDM